MGDAADEGGVELPVAYLLKPHRRRLADQFHHRVRRQSGHRRQHPVKARAQADVRADPQQRRLIGAQLSHRRQGCLLGVKEDPGHGQEGAARRGQGDSAGAAVEQLQAELAFQPPDLLADRRLDDVQPLGGPAEVEFLGDRHEVPNLTQLHTAPIHHGS